MTAERKSARSRASLRDKLKDPKYRRSFVATFVRQYLARQMRALRGDESQEDFADRLGMPQSSISRLENPAKGMNLSTIFEVSGKLDRAVLLHVVDLDTFIHFVENSLTDGAIRPREYVEKQDAQVQAPLQPEARERPKPIPAPSAPTSRPRKTEISEKFQFVGSVR